MRLGVSDLETEVTMSKLMRQPTVLGGVCVLLGLLYLLPLVMVNGAVDMFLKIEGVSGESTDANHKDWIDILSFSHGISQPISGSGSNRSAGKVTVQDMSVTKWIDKSSPELMLGTCSGRVFPKMELAVRRPSLSVTGGQTYLVYTLQDCLISSVRPAGSRGTDAVPTESLSLNFLKIEYSYKETGATGDTIFMTNVTYTLE